MDLKLWNRMQSAKLSIKNKLYQRKKHSTSWSVKVDHYIENVGLCLETSFLWMCPTQLQPCKYTVPGWLAWVNLSAGSNAYKQQHPICKTCLLTAFSELQKSTAKTQNSSVSFACFVVWGTFFPFVYILKLSSVEGDKLWYCYPNSSEMSATESRGTSETNRDGEICIFIAGGRQQHMQTEPVALMGELISVYWAGGEMNSNWLRHFCYCEIHLANANGSKSEKWHFCGGCL